MTNVIVIGHGGYANGVKKNLTMLLGEINEFHFLDFEMGEDLVDFRVRLENLVQSIASEEILFACDILGGSPFREACMLSLEKSGSAVVAGMNISALCEIAYSLQNTPKDLAEVVRTTTQESCVVFFEDKNE